MSQCATDCSILWELEPSKHSWCQQDLGNTWEKQLSQAYQFQEISKNIEGDLKTE